jgi:hypothetical protein
MCSVLQLLVLLLSKKQYRQVSSLWVAHLLHLHQAFKLCFTYDYADYLQKLLHHHDKSKLMLFRVKLIAVF